MTTVVLSCQLARHLVPVILISAAIVTEKPVIPLFISLCLSLSDYYSRSILCALESMLEADAQLESHTFMYSSLSLPS